MKPTPVLVVDDCEDLLLLTSLVLDKLCGRAAMTAKNMAELVALGPAVLGCQLAILDINLGPNEPNGIEIYGWLRSQGFTGSIVFLTGHARMSPLVIEATRLGDARVFSKPIAPEMLMRIVRGDDVEPG